MTSHGMKSVPWFQAEGARLRLRLPPCTAEPVPGVLPSLVLPAGAFGGKVYGIWGMLGSFGCHRFGTKGTCKADSAIAG